jgi:hypothetical protein
MEEACSGTFRIFSRYRADLQQFALTKPIPSISLLAYD